MSQELLAACIGAGAAIVGGLVTGAYEHLRDRISRPRLVLDFPDNGATRLESTYTVKEREVTEIFIRVRVRNVGRRVARGTRVYLVGVEEIQHAGVTQTAYKDSMPLSWPGYPKDFNPRDLQRGIHAYTNVVSVMKHEAGWHFHVPQLFASQQNLKDYSGTYRLTLLATADEAEPYHFQIDVDYRRDWHGLRAMGSG